MSAPQHPPRTASPANSGMDFAAPHGGILQRKCACGGSITAGGECEQCRKQRLQRRALGPAPDEAPPAVHEVVSSPGQPLDAMTRATMEPHFGRDFSEVRVHTDSKAAQSAQAVSAHAYTVGRHIVFGSDRYSPATPTGEALLRHELTHTIQQRGIPAGESISVAPTDTPAEREADQAAQGAPVSPRRLTGAQIQRAPSAGCVSAMARPVPSDPATGIAVEQAIKAILTGRYGPGESLTLSDASAGPMRTGRNTATIPPQKFDINVGSLLGIGRPDLAYRSRTGRAMLLAEIKPANWDQLLAGEAQLLNYINKANQDPELRRVYGVFSPMGPGGRIRIPSRVNVGPRKFRVMWCGPGIIVYQEIKPRKKKEKKKKEKKKSKEKKPKEKKPKEKKPKEKKTAAKAASVGFGISIFSASSGVANAGVGVSVGSTSVAAGTAGAGVSLFSDSAAAGSAGAGLTMNSDSAAAGSVGVGAAKGSQSVGVATAGAGTSEGSTTTAAGAAGVGTMKDSEADAAGVAGKGNVEDSSTAAAGVAASGDAKGVSGTPPNAAGGKPGGETVDGVEKPGGESPQGTNAGDDHADGGASRGGAPQGKPDAQGSGPGSTGVKDGGTGSAPAADAGGAKPGEPGGAPTAGASGAQTPGGAGAQPAGAAGTGGIGVFPIFPLDATEAQREAIRAEAARVAEALKASSEAQRALLTHLARNSGSGQYLVPTSEWVDKLLKVTEGMTPEEIEFLKQLDWKPGQISVEELKARVQAALKLRDKKTAPAASSEDSSKGVSVPAEDKAAGDGKKAGPGAGEPSKGGTGPDAKGEVKDPKAATPAPGTDTAVPPPAGKDRTQGGIFGFRILSGITSATNLTSGQAVVCSVAIEEKGRNFTLNGVSITFISRSATPVEGGRVKISMKLHFTSDFWSEKYKFYGRGGPESVTDYDFGTRKAP
jgi:hypothetical protein